MFELALAKLCQFGARNEGQYDVCGESLFDCRFDAEGVCGVDEDAGVLGSDDGVDHSGEIVHIGESFDAKHDIIKRTVSGRRCIFGISDHCGSETRQQRDAGFGW